MKLFLTILACSMLSGLAVLTLAPRAGAAEGMSVIEEVVVTARKREESLQDVPVAIQAFTTEDLVRYPADSMTELVELATLVEATPAAYGGGTFVVRGQGGNNVSNPGLDSAVGVNIDGVQIDRGHITRQSFFDLQSMQVLKGPQVVHFGKNSTAGLIVLTSAMPSDEFEAGIKAGYEAEAQEKYVEAFVSGPLTDSFLARLAYRGTDSRGWLKNEAPAVGNIAALLPDQPWDFPGAASKHFGAQQSHAGRLTLDWKPTDGFEAVLKVTLASTETDGVSTGQLIKCSLGTPATQVTTGLSTGFAPAVLVQPTGDCKLDDTLDVGNPPVEIARAIPGAGDGDPYGDYDGLLASLTLRLDRDVYSITSVTGYYHYDWSRFDNFNDTTFDLFFGQAEEDHEVWSQEVRLETTLDGPANFTLGGFYETYQRDFGQKTSIFAMGLDPVTGYAHNAESFSTIDSDSVAAFGELLWKLSDSWDFSAGARYTKDDKKADQGNSYIHAITSLFNFFLPVGEVLHSKFNDSNVSTEFTLSWHPRDEMMIYAAYREGYKAGGFSTNTVIDITKTGDVLTFDPEEVDGFEAGLKSIWLDGRLQVNATAFDYDYKGMQVNAFDARTTTFTIINAASAETRGLEIESQYLATPELTLRGALAFNKADFNRFPNAQCYSGQTAAQGCVGGVQDLSGEDQNTPDVEAQLGFDYVKAIADGLNFELSYTALYRDGYDLIRLEGVKEDGLWRHNVSVGIVGPDGRWSAFLRGRNVTDEIYPTAGTFGCGDVPGAVSPPGGNIGCGTGGGRQVYLEATYRL